MLDRRVRLNCYLLHLSRCHAAPRCEVALLARASFVRLSVSRRKPVDQPLVQERCIRVSFAEIRQRAERGAHKGVD